MRKRFLDNLVGERRAGYNLSWGSIIAGVVTFLALFIVFTTIGSAIGLGVIDFTSSNPFSGLGTGSIIWIVITMLISFFGSGFVSGVAARRVGLLHGFVTWASNLVVLVVFITILLSSLLSLAGSAIGATANVTGNVIGTGADAATTAVTEGFTALSENVNVDTEEVDQQTRDILEGTGVEELQPEYIEDQLAAAGTDITEAGQQLLTDPNNAEQIATDLADQLSSRAENIGQEVDEEAISNSVAENTDLTGQEAEEATQTVVQGLEQTTTQAQEALDNAGTQLQQLQQDLDQAVQELQTTANEATNVSAWSLVGLFVFHILMAIVSSLGGMSGANLVKDLNSEDEV